MRHFTPVYSLALLLFSVSFFSPEKNVAQTPVAFSADTAAARHQLDIAQRQLDSSRYDLALPHALEAERLLLQYFDSTDVRMTDAYCFVGLCFLKNQVADAAQYYRKQALALLPQATGLSRAHILFYNGSCLISLDGDLEGALGAYQMAIDQYLRMGLPGRPPHQNAARAHSNMGVILFYQSRFEESLKHQQQAEDWLIQIHGPMHPNVAHPYNNRGLVLWQSGRYDEALFNFEKAYDIRSKTLPFDHVETGAVLNNLGLVYVEKGAFDDAKYWFQKAFTIGDSLQKTELLASSHSNLGMVANKKGEYAEALQHFRETLILEQNAGALPFQIVTTLINIGIGFKDLARAESKPELLDSALIYYQKALDRADPTHNEMDELFNAFGVVYELKATFPLAKIWYKKALNLQKERFSAQSPSISVAYFNLANVALAEGDFEKALLYNDSAQWALGYAGKGDFDHADSFLHLAEVLLQQNKLLWSHPAARLDPRWLQKLRKSCDQTFEVFEKAELTVRETADRFVLQSAAYATYEIAIAAQIQLQKLTGDEKELEEAFRLTEKSKSSVLLQAIRESKALSFAGIDPEIVKQERELQAKIAYQEGQLLRMVQDSALKSSPSVQVARDHRHELLAQHNTLRRSLALENRTFHDAYFGAPTVALPWLRDTFLSSRQTILEYFVGDSNIVLFIVQKNHLEALEIKKDFPLELWIDSLTRLGIYAWHTLPDGERPATPSASVRIYTKFAVLLFDKLLDSIGPKLGPELIIIPDGVLSNVPFEALLPDAPERPTVFKTYRFWVEDKVISYCYSATLLKEMWERPQLKQAEQPVLALAPFSLKGLGGSANKSPGGPLDQLEFSGKELDGIARFFPGKYFKAGQATREVFVRQAEYYCILHLSTHGCADDRAGDFSYLLFEKNPKKDEYNKLFARDLYAMRIRADLVTLSACETGRGRLQRGEGIIGLSRAFSFAGAKSLVVSLWKVNDENTTKLMVDFYQNLHAAKPKNEALCLAKRSFLESNREAGGGALRHPFFWAGFVAIGDMRALR